MNEKEELELEKKHLKVTVQLAKKSLHEEEIIGENIKKSTDDDFLLQILSKRHDTKIRNLKRAIKNPYFARIDFQEKTKEKQEIYIGKTNIFDEQYNVAVADWRAPISSVYYDGEIGETEYICPEGKIKGNLLLKRQFQIEEGELKSYNNITLTANDELLQECLNEKSDSKLRNIVATIQKKQNKIIRSNMFKPLIVQGVAGSGKTTVAIHRIAYLIYTYEDTFNPEEFLIIAPNKFFLGYIKDSLPDLGVDDVRQETLEELAYSIIKDKITIEDANNNLIKIVERKKDYEMLEKTTKFKGSFEFKEILDEYLEILEESILEKRDFTIENVKLISYQNIQTILSQNKDRYSLKTRIENLKNYLKNKVENNSEEIIERIIEKRRKQISQIDINLNDEEKQKEKIKIFEKYEIYIKELSNGKSKKIVDEYIKKIKIPTPLQSLKAIIQDNQLMKNTDEEVKEYIRNENKKNKVAYEDIAALLHLQYKIIGINNNLKLKHIVIDEAQDFSEFLFYSLNEIMNKNKSLTILGDIAQGIYEYRGCNNWEKINKEIFNNEAKIEYLNQSYRTTFEIMEEAKKILENIQEEYNLQLAEPIVRHGEKVEYIELDDNKIEKIAELINKELEKGNNNIAIICKDEKEVEEIYNKLEKEKIEIKTITSKSQKYEGGITIVPSYYSKGLEFDSVIISDKNKYKDNTLDKKLLYVAYTRAMHKLYVL